MNPFDDHIRVTLQELAEEAVPVNLADQALRGARRRRVAMATAGAAVFAAVGLGVAPLALADIGHGTNPADNSRPPAPSTTEYTPARQVPPAPSPTVTSTVAPPHGTTPPPTTTPPATTTPPPPLPSPTVSGIASTPPPVPSPTR
jgi:hypothetical protein